MLETILKEHGGALLAAVTQGSDLDASQAESLIPPALGGIGDAIAGGDLDLSSLLAGGGDGVAALLGKLDVGAIAGQAGLDEGQARDGLSSLIPVVLSLLGDKAGGADGLMSMLGGLGGGNGGGAGALAGLAGKLFGK
ncbi:MAG: hypothetical protein NXI30_08070 [bacterium]|nr:hypothetical protein [bacterium]